MYSYDKLNLLVHCVHKTLNGHFASTSGVSSYKSFSMSVMSRVRNQVAALLHCPYSSLNQFC